MHHVRRTLTLAIPLLVLLLATPAAEVVAASATGRANATVVTPSVVAPVTVSVVTPVSMPSVVTRVASSRSNASSTRLASASLTSADLAGSNEIVTVAGVSVETLDSGTVISFSIAGDTTSAYVVQLGPTDSLEPGSVLASDGVPGLILTAQPLAGAGQLSVVLSQTPSELIAGAVSLSVNYN